MALASKFPDHPCKLCGVTIKKGDMVEKLEATGAWCSNPNCPNPQGAAPPTPQPTARAPKVRMSAEAIAAEILAISHVMQTKIMDGFTEENDPRKQVLTQIIWTEAMIEGAWKYANTVRMQEK